MKAVRAVLAVAACGLFVACGGSSSASKTEAPPTSATLTVDVRNIAFNPQSVTVHPGQTVGWKFDDGAIPHNVVGTDWRSPDRTSGYYTHTFTSPGTYPYRCTIHSNMDGQVGVTP